ncbi:peptidyl-tRNA hydrolase [Aureococcus anophagefferens]|nr:peptidyl-tRNA hydrolase [Aureococcus anophagefferens]
MGLPPRDSATRSLVSRDGGPESKVVLELFQAFDHMERTPRAPVAARRPPTRPGERHEAHRELYVEEARRAILLASQYADLNAATAAQLEAAAAAATSAATAALRACTDALLVEARRGAAPPAAPADGDAPRAPPPPCETPAPRRRRRRGAARLRRDALHLLRLHYLADDGRPRYEQLCGDLGIVPHLADFRTAQRIAAELAGFPAMADGAGFGYFMGFLTGTAACGFGLGVVATLTYQRMSIPQRRANAKFDHLSDDEGNANAVDGADSSDDESEPDAAADGAASNANSAATVLGAYKRGARKAPAAVKWWSMTGQAKVCVKVPKEEELLELQATLAAAGVVSYLVEDAGRTQVAPGSKTVLAVGPAPVKVLDQFTKHLKLY